MEIPIIQAITLSDKKRTFDLRTELPDFWKNNLYRYKRLIISPIEIMGAKPIDIALFLQMNDIFGTTKKIPFNLYEHQTPGTDFIRIDFDIEPDFTPSSLSVEYSGIFTLNFTMTLTNRLAAPL